MHFRLYNLLGLSTFNINLANDPHGIVDWISCWMPKIYLYVIEAHFLAMFSWWTPYICTFVLVNTNDVVLHTALNTICPVTALHWCLNTISVTNGTKRLSNFWQVYGFSFSAPLHSLFSINIGTSLQLRGTTSLSARCMDFLNSSIDIVWLKEGTESAFITTK